MLIVLASLLPGAFWLWYFNRYDVWEKEPVWRLLLTTAAGAISVVPALIWEAPFTDLFSASNSLAMQVFLSFLVVGLGEELCKLLAVILSAFRTSEFNEPMDGIIYAAAAAIGFSVVENVLYITSFGLAIAPLRATVSTLAHIAFSGLGGYFLGLAKMAPKPWAAALLSLIVAAFLHGAFDFLLITGLVAPCVLVIAILGLQALLFGAIRNAVRLSPFR